MLSNDIKDGCKFNVLYDISDIVDGLSIDGVVLNDNFYKYIDSIEVLSSEQEKKLFTLLCSDNKKISKYAKDKIVISNLKLVRSIVYKYSKNSILSFSDLMHEGIIGLHKAIEYFDISKDNKFSTYAYLWIEQAIIEACRKPLSGINFSTCFLDRKREYLRIKCDYIEKNGFVPSFQYMKQEMCKILKVKLSDKELSELIKMIERYSLDSISLSLPIDLDGVCCFEDIIPDNNSFMDEELEKQELSDIVEKIMDKICVNDMEKYIIYYRFCLNEFPKLTYEELGKIFGISRQTVRNKEKKVLNKIRTNNYCKRILFDYYK